MVNRGYYFVFLLIIIGLNAQESIQPDRPDQTETPVIIPKNYLQLETGILFEKKDQTLSTLLIPTILTKYGLTQNTELRVITEFENIILKNKSSYQFVPVTVGVKTSISEEKGWLPKTSIIAHLQLFAKNQNGNNQFIPSFRFTFQNTISETTSIGYNLGMEWNEDLQENYIYTFSASKSMGKKWGTFAEIYGYISPFYSADVRLDAGFSYLIHDHFQLDLSGGIGISAISPHYFISTGWSYRFPISAK